MSGYCYTCFTFFFSFECSVSRNMLDDRTTHVFKINLIGFCMITDFRFVSKGELEAHTRKHSGAHPFVCDVCGGGFTTSSSLVKHKRIHTGERPYQCDFCPMRFTALGTLKNHRRRHTGEKPYKYDLSSSVRLVHLHSNSITCMSISGAAIARKRSLKRTIWFHTHVLIPVNGHMFALCAVMPSDRALP